MENRIQMYNLQEAPPVSDVDTIIHRVVYQKLIGDIIQEVFGLLHPQDIH
jgi:hypothetical protein